MSGEHALELAVRPEFGRDQAGDDVVGAADDGNDDPHHLGRRPLGGECRAHCGSDHQESQELATRIAEGHGSSSG